MQQMLRVVARQSSCPYITLYTSNHMRRFPLRAGVNAGFATVVFHDDNSTNSSNTSNVSSVFVIAAAPSEESHEYEQIVRVISAGAYIRRALFDVSFFMLFL